jgi:hypothetical protein
MKILILAIKPQATFSHNLVDPVPKQAHPDGMQGQARVERVDKLEPRTRRRELTHPWVN